MKIPFKRRRQRNQLLAIMADDSLGRPSHCMFGDEAPAFVIYGETNQAFVCHEHIGEFISTWTIEQELSVVRL